MLPKQVGNALHFQIPFHWCINEQIKLDTFNQVYLKHSCTRSIIRRPLLRQCHDRFFFKYQLCHCLLKGMTVIIYNLITRQFDMMI